MRIVIALGGNAMTSADGRATPTDQIAAIKKAASPVAELVAQGHELLLTHGNGPQVGNLLVKNELTSGHVPPVPLDWCGAQTQGTIGMLVVNAIDNAFARRELRGRGGQLVVYDPLRLLVEQMRGQKEVLRMAPCQLGPFRIGGVVVHGEQGELALRPPDRDRPPLVADTMRWFINTYVEEGDIRSQPDLSPLQAELPAGLPPSYIITVDNDPLSDEGGRYALKLAAKGVRVRYDHLPGYAHGLFTSAGRVPTGEHYLHEAADFIRENSPSSR